MTRHVVFVCLLALALLTILGVAACHRKASENHWISWCHNQGGSVTSLHSVSLFADHLCLRDGRVIGSWS